MMKAHRVRSPVPGYMVGCGAPLTGEVASVGYVRGAIERERTATAAPFSVAGAAELRVSGGGLSTESRLLQ